MGTDQEWCEATLRARTRDVDCAMPCTIMKRDNSSGAARKTKMTSLRRQGAQDKEAEESAAHGNVASAAHGNAASAAHGNAASAASAARADAERRAQTSNAKRVE